MHSIVSGPLGRCFTVVAGCAAVGFALSSALGQVPKVVAYDPGQGFATEFGSGLGFTNAVAALAEPSSVTPGDFGGPVHPFNPPFLRDQLLSIGAGGALTLEFEEGLFNNPGNPFGIDFLVFGNSGFTVVNGDFSGGGVTDGSLFSADSDQSRVSVSANGVDFFLLDPERAPGVDGLFPTDGQGDFMRPVDPALSGADFDGLGLEGIRALYAGAAGGAGFDLDWATDADGEPVYLERAHFVRVEVIEGKSEIDAVVPVAPSLPARLASVTERFDADPRGGGWETAGDVSLYSWDADREALAATWDSSKPNSYFFRNLHGRLSKSDDFTIAFDLQLDEVAIGVAPEKPFTFPIAVGLFNREQAFREGLFRGTGINLEHGARGTVEWNYLPDSGFGATVSSGLISLDNQWAFQNTFPLELRPGVAYTVRLEYRSATETLATTMTADGAPFGPIEDAKLSEIFGNPLDSGFTDVDVDMLAVASFSDAGQSPPEFAGSIFARGWIDNLSLQVAGSLAIDGVSIDEGRAIVRFQGRPGRRYWLERTADFKSWRTVDAALGEADGEAALTALLATDETAGFYRLRGGL